MLARLRDFAAHSERGLQYALVQDGTGLDGAEIHEMNPSNRMLTAYLRARFWKWWASELFPDNKGGKQP